MPVRAKSSIAFTLTLVLLFLFTLGQGSLWVWFLFVQKDLATRTLDEKVEAVVSLLAHMSENAIAGGKPWMLENILKGAGDNVEILSLRVTDTAGTELASSVFGSEDKTTASNPFYIPWVNAKSFPLIDGFKDLGTLEVSYSGRSANTIMLKFMTVYTLVEGMVIAILIIGSFIYVRQKIGLPLALLGERMKSITAGDLTVEIPDSPDAEIGIISDGMKYMVKAMLDNISKINSTAQQTSEVARELERNFGDLTHAAKEQAEVSSHLAESLDSSGKSYTKIIDNTDSLNELSSDNTTLLLEVKSTADEIALSSNNLFAATEDSYAIMEEMSQTSKVMAENSEQVLAAVEESLTSLEEIRASVKEVERSAVESSAMAADVRSMAEERGTLAIADAVKASEDIEGEVQMAVELVQSLEVKSYDIQKTVSVIKEVNEQTNLLSLNAAILAEQAGEFGKGFSVVAEEMTSLSERTAGSTKEITSIIKTIQGEIQNVVGSIQSMMGLVRKGSGLVNNVGENMGDILKAAEKSSKMSTAIENATVEQAHALDLVAESVGNVSGMASQMTKAMEEQMKSSSYMLERVGEIKEISEFSKRSTGEQAKGSALMSKNISETDTRVTSINAAAREQQALNEEASNTSRVISENSSLTLEQVGRMSEVISSLVEGMNDLKSAIGSFKVDK